MTTVRIDDDHPDFDQLDSRFAAGDVSPVTYWVAKSNDSLDLLYVHADESVVKALVEKWGCPATAEQMTRAELTHETIKRLPR